MRMELDEKTAIDDYKRANVLYKKGEKLYQNSDIEKAAQELAKCVEIAPNHAEARLILALINYRQGKLEQALGEIEQAKNNYAKLAHYKALTEQEFLGRDTSKIKRVDDTIAMYYDKLNAARTNEERQAIQSTISDLQAQKATLSMPVPDQPLLVETTPKIPATYFFVHGNILLKMKKPVEAVAQYEAAIQADAKHTGAYNNLASVFLAGGNPQKAMEYINTAEAKGVVVNAELKKEVQKTLGR